MDIALIVDNIRSTHNIGSLLRTCDGIGVSKVFICGITPYPHMRNDTRLPHLSERIAKDIHKTALGAEDTVAWEYVVTTQEAIHNCRNAGYQIVALEQSRDSIPLQDYKPQGSFALIVGPEVTGISQEVLNLASAIVEIPMHGSKESFNVSVAAAIALYALSNSLQ